MNELNKKLAEWAGFREHTGYQGVWIQPDNKDYDDELPNFTQSLDACFKWLVPKLWICDMQMLEGIFFVWEVGYPAGGSAKGSAKETPALALCLAIDKLIGDKDV